MAQTRFIWRVKNTWPDREKAYVQLFDTVTKERVSNIICKNPDVVQGEIQRLLAIYEKKPNTGVNTRRLEAELKARLDAWLLDGSVVVLL
jgi:hypothetical protein